MQIVIDIPEEYYDYIKEHHYMDRYYDTREKSKIFCAIKNGTPLPKGHGRLIDADVLVDGMEDNYEFCEAVNATPTIIEADRAESEGME